LRKTLEREVFQGVIHFWGLSAGLLNGLIHVRGTKYS
jgi:hypothetical protein